MLAGCRMWQQACLNCGSPAVPCLCAQASAAAAGAGVTNPRPAASGGAGLVGRVTDLGRQVLHTILHPGQPARSEGARLAPPHHRGHLRQT